jgi:transglutaminase-like putative cysteine protease
VALREVAQAPVDPATFDSPLALFRSFTKQHADDVQFVVQGLPAGARLRLASLDDYDGRQFRLSDAAGPFVRIGPERPSTGSTASVPVTIRVQDYAGRFLPLPGAIQRLDFGGARADELAADLRYSAGEATGLVPGGWQPGDEYRVVAGIAAQPGADQLAGARPSPVPLPASVTVPDLLRSQTERYTTGATTPAAQVEAIRAGLARDGFFSHGRAGEPASPAGHGLDRLVGMVGSGSMLGDQEQYAALMAVMVRSLGIPARVVVGFAPGTTSGDVPVELRGQDITAWVEVPFEGFGWVAFDPTPSPDKPVTDTQERAQTERRAVSVEEPPALPQIPPDTADTDAADQQPQEPAPPAPAESPTFLPALVLTMLAWTAAVLALVAAPVVAILVIKSRRRRRRLAAPKPADRITGGWQQLLDTAVDTGYRPTPWHTRTEAARDLTGAGVLQVDWLAPAADAAQFSPTPVDEDRARSYWREVDDRSAELLGGLGFWRRWRARLSLASLRRRDR